MLIEIDMGHLMKLIFVSGTQKAENIYVIAIHIINYNINTVKNFNHHLINNKNDVSISFQTLKCPNTHCYGTQYFESKLSL
jgi:hypothetical protein